jgi:hypothetical protein
MGDKPQRGEMGCGLEHQPPTGKEIATISLRPAGAWGCLAGQPINIASHRDLGMPRSPTRLLRAAFCACIRQCLENPISNQATPVRDFHQW